jgi:lipopolysaccharide transport system permease protein
MLPGFLLVRLRQLGMLGNLKSSVGDLIETQRRFRLVHILGWQDLKARYKRSLLGPFWLTLSTGVLIASMTLILGASMRIPMVDYLPYVTIGYIMFNKLTSVITESCQAFISSSSMIRQVPVPLFVYVERVVWRNLLKLGHDIVLIPLAFWIVSRSINLNALYFVPGFLLFLLNVTWVGLLLGVLSTRYRDLPMTVGSILPIFFYLTPIIWMPDFMPGKLGLRLLEFNPFYHMISLVRAPLMGDIPSYNTWIFCGIAAVLGWIVAMLVYARSRDRVVFWL